jgi:hypothetical protein
MSSFPGVTVLDLMGTVWEELEMGRVDTFCKRLAQFAAEVRPCTFSVCVRVPAPVCRQACPWAL